MKILSRCFPTEEDLSDGEETTDADAENLTYVGKAAYEVLRTKHNQHHNTLWNVTSGKVVGNLHQTPKDSWPGESDPPENHDDWFPEIMGEIMSRTKTWCDVMSLGPPDGLFMEKVKEALAVIAENAKGREKPVIIRMMFGNIVGMPVNCRKVIKKLKEDLENPDLPNIELWVGAWRKGASWNHAKIIAVDGYYIHTGGHNLWDPHYLKNNPVQDLSLEMEGPVAHDGHLFANRQWQFIEELQSTLWGSCVDRLPDSLPIVVKSRVTVSEYPREKAATFPPMYRRRAVLHREKPEDSIPIIAMGRYGTILYKDRPSDDAIVAMMDASKTVIRMALQDLGPVCIPGTKMALPGCKWPGNYLTALGRAIFERGVDVEIALSNPGSIPGGLTATEANYGNGWSCVDVAAEIIKRIKHNYSDADGDRLAKMVEENLRVCFVRNKSGNKWEDGGTMGMHAKHFIVDDTAAYIGSQNLYVCDLAEWGVVIDNEEQVKVFMDEYWNPMWESSFTGEDVNVDDVMDGLEIERDGEDPSNLSDEAKQAMDGQKLGVSLTPTGVKNPDYYDDEEDEDEAA